MLPLGSRTLVMGILNVTPDSFADGGRFLDPAAAESAAVEMQSLGADIIDVGGESTRPGSEPVGVEAEIARVRPVLRRLARSVSVPISIDTTKPEVAEMAVSEGAVIVNDVTGLRYDPALARLAARAGAALVLMHSRGRSRDMYSEASYISVADEVASELHGSVVRAVDAGVPRSSIVLDPGLGFAKRAEHSYAALAGLAAVSALGFPLLVGPSRKSFLAAAIGEREPGARDWGTAAAVTAAALLGAHIVRVHNVAAALDAVRVADAIRAASPAAGPGAC